MKIPRSVPILLSLLVPVAAPARPVSGDEAARAVSGWLARSPRPAAAKRRAAAPAAETEVRTVPDGNGGALFHVVRPPSGGIVVVSAETSVGPVVAFADADGLEESPENPLYAILVADLVSRTAQARRAGGAEPAVAAAEAAWDELLSGKKYGRASVPDVRVAPLLETAWDQGADAAGNPCANFYTPNGYLCGCVALAGAQIARFWKFPSGSRPSVRRLCRVSGRSRWFSTLAGTYDWDLMPETFGPLSAERREAIGKLCFDFGVATCMDWSASGSGTGGFLLDDAFASVFGYANSRVYATSPNGAFPQDTVERTVLANLDAGCPVALGIDGHEVVADGYGYASSVLYVHLDLGWGGDDNAWYNLPVVDGRTYSSTVLDEVVYNVFPEKTGDLLTGRVLDAAGSPVAGASVSAGGATARTGATGVYALWVEGGTNWVVEARAGGLSGSRDVHVTRSVSSDVSGTTVAYRSGTPGNSWGNDIALRGSGDGPEPLHRFYSKNYKSHFFTIDEEEKDGIVAGNPNWSYEGVACFAFAAEAPGTTALHRFYSKNYRGHFFTADEAEMRAVRDTNPNWNYEGVACYVYPSAVAGSVPVFRFWSKRYRHHFYTADEAEKDDLVANNPNWAFECVAFHALPAPGADASSAPAGDAEHGATRTAHAAAWTLAAADGTAVAVPGVTAAGDMLVEAREEAPDADELAGDDPATRDSGNPASGDADSLVLRLSLPDGAFDAALWSAAEGTVAEEPVEGAFDFALPATGVWHWLRVRDEDDDAFSVWLRAE